MCYIIACYRKGQRVGGSATHTIKMGEKGEGL